jgi:hypothetical protein
VKHILQYENGHAGSLMKGFPQNFKSPFFVSMATVAKLRSLHILSEMI